MTTETNTPETVADAPKAKRASKPKAPKAPKATKASKPKAPKATKASKPAKPKAPKAPSNGEARDRLVPADLSKYVKDTEHKTASGNASIHCNDELANQLAGKDLDFAYRQAARVLKVEERDLRKQYAHLNVGMQRMNLGNRMRKAARVKAAA